MRFIHQGWFMVEKHDNVYSLQDLYKSEETETIIGRNKDTGIKRWAWLCGYRSRFLVKGRGFESRWFIFFLFFLHLRFTKFHFEECVCFLKIPFLPRYFYYPWKNLWRFFFNSINDMRYILEWNLFFIRKKDFFRSVSHIFP